VPTPFAAHRDFLHALLAQSELDWQSAPTGLFATHVFVPMKSHDAPAAQSSGLVHAAPTASLASQSCVL
jgi:hypothetical protein